MSSVSDQVISHQAQGNRSRGLRVLCVIDWLEPRRWLWDYLPDSQDEVRFVSMEAPRDRFPGWGKFLSYYPAYLRHAWRAVRLAKDSDVLVGWEAKNGFPLGMIRRLTGRPKKGKIVILNFTPRGPLYSVPKFIEWGLAGVNFLTCTNHADMDFVQRCYHVPENKVQVLVHPSSYPPAEWEKLRQQTAPADYILAAGRSYRDYGTLIKAVDGLNVPVRICARSFNIPDIPIPSNVQISDLLPPQPYHAAIMAARIIVVPLMPTGHAVGDAQVVEAMAASKPIVVTETPGMRDCIRHGQNGLVVPPGDVGAMRQAIQYLLDHPAEARRLGEAAYIDYETKYTIARWAPQVESLLHSVAAM